MKERGQLIGVRNVSDEPRLLHCLRMGQLQSENQYRKEAASSQAQCHLPMDMMYLVHARKAQALAREHCQDHGPQSFRDWVSHWRFWRHSGFREFISVDLVGLLVSFGWRQPWLSVMGWIRGCGEGTFWQQKHPPGPGQMCPGCESSVGRSRRFWKPLIEVLLKKTD